MRVSPQARRQPAVAQEAMIATSQPLATEAGLRAFERGGNAVDAALAAAAMLCVTEPMSTGVGGDAFAIVWTDGEPVGLDAAGPAPAGADPDAPVAERGPTSVTVPGAVGGWQALADRFGRLGLDACLAGAIDAAERGYPVSPVAAAAWSDDETRSASWARSAVPPELAPAPRAGDEVRLPELGATLRRIADRGAEGLYRGEVAEAICAASWLEESDLAAYQPAWTEPLRVRYRDHEVAELPPPTQGVAALEALALLEGLEPTLASQARCASLALEDAYARVRDGADVSDLLSAEAIASRRRAVAVPVSEPAGGTVYLCAVDGEGTAVSFIQSLYGNFGSGIVAPGTGVVLQNRGACFAISGRVEPGRRPYHTIIPGMLLRDGELAGPFGVMGGFIQAQAHMQLVSGLVDRGLDPQAALDTPRFRVEGDQLFLEEGLWDRADELERHGYRVVRDRDTVSFGGGQSILRTEAGLVGGSDPRKDGYAGAFR
jgi:gamma-glutamyltranspeptidase/glutathione hydrolase